MRAAADRYRSLDHWRGIAALWVVFFHAGVGWADLPPAGLAGWLPRLYSVGWFGFHLFFVISGYCIGVRAAQDFAQSRGGGSFLFDRAWRILPVYWAALLLAIVAALVAQPFNHVPLASAPGQPGVLPGSLAHLGIDLALLGPWFGYQPYLLVSWTLTSELVFYLLIAAGLAFAKWMTSAWPALALLVGLAFVIAARPALLSTTPLAFWPEFVCGLLTWLSGRMRATRPAIACLCWAMITGLGVLGTLGNEYSTTLPWAAAFALLLAMLRPFDGRIAEFSAFRWLGFCGIVSYSLYLIHMPIISPLRNLIIRYWPPTSPGFAVVPIALTAIATGAGWLFYRVVELAVEQRRKARRRTTLA